MHGAPLSFLLAMIALPVAIVVAAVVLALRAD